MLPFESLQFVVDRGICGWCQEVFPTARDVPRKEEEGRLGVHIEFGLIYTFLGFHYNQSISFNEIN